MEKVYLDILGLSSSHHNLNNFALVLGEKNGNRRLPIIIGGFEAQAIALEIESIKPHRPMTHDLIVSITQSFDIDLLEVIISELREGTFYSKLVLSLDGEIKEVDARPSDAIALAVRYRAPILTYEDILEEAGIIVKESKAQEARRTQRATYSTREDTSKELQIKRLEEKMKEAIDKEDYEEAAKLRDQISKIGGNV